MRIIVTLVLFLAGLPVLRAQTCPNRCLDFDGASDFVQSAAAPVTGNADFTAEARFYCTSPTTSTAFRRLFAFGGASTRIEVGEIGGKLAYQRLSSAGTFGPSQVPTTTGIPLRANGWHHVAVRRSGGALTFFLDCDSVYTTTLPGNLNINAFRLGTWVGSSQAISWWDGQIDEVRVWNTARTSVEIQATCACGLTGNESGLSLYYDFDQTGIIPAGNNAGQTTVQDQTVNNNDGTLNSFLLDTGNSNWLCGDLNFAECGNCAAAFSYTVNCGVVQFTNLTQQPLPPPYTYAWDFNNDGTTDSNLPNPSWTPPGPGTYTTCLNLVAATGGVFCQTCHTVTVGADVQLPVALCVAPFSLSLPAGGGTVPLAVGMINNGSTDNCGIENMSLNVSGFNCADACGPNGPLGPRLVELTVTDHSGNQATCTTLVQVKDMTPPVAVCKAINISIANPPLTILPAAVDGGSTDNCGIVSRDLSQTTFDCPQPCPMTSVVTLTVTDCSGNSSSCTAQVTVEDEIPPAVTCPPSITVNGTISPAGACTAVVNNIAVNATDNCAINSLKYTLTGATTGMASNGNAGGTAFNQGATTVVYQAEDGCGNLNGCSFTVVVLDCDVVPPGGGFPGFGCGEAIFDCFSGFTTPPAISDPPPNSNKIKDDVVLALADVRNHALAIPFTFPSQAWPGVHPLYHHPDWTSGKMGQIFGLAIDNQNNVYAAASTIHGQMPPGGLPSAGPGTIYKIDANTGIPSVWVNLPNSLTSNGNIRSGLGDLTYDADHNCLFASNFHDGMIYRLDMSGNVVQKFDPPLNDPAVIGQGFYNPNAPAGFAPRGQRIWGIGYHENTLYFGVWVEDHSNENLTRDNEIWSVPLNSVDGSFTGLTNSNNDFYEFAQLERSTIDQTALGWSPISDITFSCSGDILLAARTMRADYNTWNTSLGTFAHFSPVWKLPLSNLSGPIQEYFIGIGNGSSSPRTNGSGGIDIGYGAFDPASSNLPTVLDDKVWVTADAMLVNSTAVVYGLSGLPFSGNTYADVGNTSIFIDADNDPTGFGKTYYGDVEVFKCLSCIETPPCDGITATLPPVSIVGDPGKDCCYRLDINNTVPNTFASINVIVDDASLNILDVTPTAGWSIGSFVNNESAALEHSSGYVPTGSFSAGTICLTKPTYPTQTITLQFLDAQGFVLCDTTFKVHCDFCIAVSRDTIECADNGLQRLTFCIQSAATMDYPISSVVLNPPPGVTFTPASFSIPPLAPGATYCTITTMVDLGTSGLTGELCYGITVHEADVTKGVPPLRCCMIDQCTTLPDCLCDTTRTYATFRPAPPLGPGLCCYDISLHQPAGAFVSVETAVISAGGYFDGFGFDPDWSSVFVTVPKDIVWTPNPSSPLPALTTLPTLCFAGDAPQVLEITWMTDDDKFCKDQLQFNCRDSACAVLDSISLVCNTIGGTVSNFKFTVTNLSGEDATHIALVNVSPAGIITGPTIFPINLPDGTTSPILMTMFNNAVGPEACFQINLYHQNPDNPLDIKDCCLTEEIFCLTLPRCTLETLVQPIVLFPNPARDELTVYFGDGAPANGYLRVRDLAGRLLLDEAVPAGAQAHHASVYNLSSGLYFVEFVENQRRVWSEKMVKQGAD